MGRLFFGGVPTKMDVDKLMSEVEVTLGSSIPYTQVADMIGVRVGEHRFRTVTGAWRKRLFREKFVQTAAYGEAFHFLTADEAHDHALGDVHKVGRMAGRLRVRTEAIVVTDLTGERRDRQNLLRREMAVIHEAMQKSAKAIAAPAPTAGSTLRLAK